MTIPTGGFQQGGSSVWGGGGGRGRGGCKIHAGRDRNPFATHMATVIGRGGAGQYISPFGGQIGFPGAPIPPLMQQQQQHRDRATPNPVKRYNNWNVCYSCGFDVEDGLTLVTCLFLQAYAPNRVHTSKCAAVHCRGARCLSAGVHKTRLLTNPFA